MSLPYNNNVPQASQTIASSQDPIQKNFASIDTAFNDGSGIGNFTKYAMQNVGNLTVAPVDPIGVYHTQNGANFFLNKPIPFFANSSGDFPLMPDLKTSGSNFGFKIGNIIVNYGSVTSGGGNTVVVTVAIPFTSVASYYALGMPNNGGSFTEGQWTVTNNSASQFTFRRGSSTTGAVTANYFAIGT